MESTLAELILLEHTEDFVQWVPNILLGAAIAVLLWHSLSESAASLRCALREFKEYRPYANIEPFRKEIGKYVALRPRPILVYSLTNHAEDGCRFSPA
jgi:hypothetical protein